MLMFRRKELMIEEHLPSSAKTCYMSFSTLPNTLFAIGYATLFLFLLEGKVPSGLGKLEKLASFSVLFSLQKPCLYSLNLYALKGDKVLSEYMR